DETGHYVTAFGNSVSKSLAKRISAYTARDLSPLKTFARVLDTGASKHMLNPPKRVRFGDETFAEATGIGQIQLMSNVKGKQILLTLSDVLYVPSFQVSLISVQKLAEKGNLT
ncbi:hypothetical protein B0H12DRAFT_999273, partial [Mycena haematopus]